MRNREIAQLVGMKTNRALAKAEGYETIDELLEASCADSISPGICMECDYTTEVEPDQDEGWCEECEKGSVKSALVLAGII